MEWDRIYGVPEYPERIHREIVRSIVFRRTKSYIAISNQTKKEIIQGVDEGKRIAVIYEGVDPAFFVSKSEKKKTILMFADFSKRNNLAVCMDAFARSNVWQNGIKLVVVCSNQRVRARVRLLAVKYHIETYVDTRIDVSVKALSLIYRQSHLLLYPSLYEGFGLPILEAFAAGCAVITSDFGAMKEIGKNAAYFVDPYCVEQVANGIKEIITKKNVRMRLESKGRKEAARFTWEQTARLTIREYDRLNRRLD